MTLLKGIKFKYCLTISVQAFPKNVYCTGQTIPFTDPKNITNDSSKY